MLDWMPRIIVILLLIAVVGVPFVLRPRDDAAQAASEDGPRLVIITPHNEQIRYEFERAFNAYRVSRSEPPVTFDWRTSGGTSDLRRQVLTELAAEYKAAHEEGRRPKSLGYDLFFGGGDFEHNLLGRGDSFRDAEGKNIAIPPASEVIQLPPGMLEEVFPSDVIGDAPLYHKELRWVGTALSSFGIVYNRDVLAMKKLPEPVTWSDLTAEAYMHEVALADPGHSGSIGATYNAILRRLGWEDGWWTLRRVFANARYFASSASQVPVDVSAGQAAAGMCIDFYGRYQSGAIGPSTDERVGGEARVGYADPPQMTAITADPISIIHMAPNKELANAFVIWTLSSEAQQLWNARRGTTHGPRLYELRRLAIRRDMYTEQHMTDWVDDENPFELAKPFAPGMPDYYRAITPVAHAMAIDIHDELSTAYQAMIDHPDHPRIEEMRRLFDAMPDDLIIPWPDDELRENWVRIVDDPNHPRNEEASKIANDFISALKPKFSDPKASIEARLKWTAFFRENYRQIVRISKAKD